MKKGRWLKVILSMAFVLVLMAGTIHYVVSVQESLWKQTVADVLEVTSQGSHAFEVYIKQDMDSLERLGRKLSEKTSGDGVSIASIVEMFNDSTLHCTVIDLEHRRIFYDGDINGHEIDAQQMAIYETFADQGVSEPYMDERTGQTLLGCYQRFTFLDGTQGIVRIGRWVSLFAEEFMFSLYNNEGFSYIVNADGDILIRTIHQNSARISTNVLDVIELSGNRLEDIRVFRDGITEDETGVVKLIFNGEENVFVFVPISGTDGWYFITIVPDAVVTRHAGDILKSTQTFVILLGTFLLMAGIVIYIDRWSHKKIMEKEEGLRHRENLFNILSNNTDDVFLMLSTTDYTVDYVSPNVERIIGIPWQKVKKDVRVLKRNPYDSLDHVDYEELTGMKVGSVIVSEGEWVHRKDGERRFFMETIYKIALDNSERYVVVLSDRTAEHKSEQALKEALEIAKTANEAKSAFLSNMSHDIRTPMNAIVGLSALLQRDADKPEKVQEYTRKITASSHHLLGLINDVLDMSKIESGKTMLNISEINLAEIVEELGTMINPQAKAKQQEFKIYVSDISHEELLGDRLRINQILINILSNAVKYTPIGGKIDMTVRQLPQSKKNYARLQFVIKDNGVGMSEEYLNIIFQPFSRENTNKTSGIQGTGLGMAITKNLVDLMGGTIAVESKSGEGSKFTVDLELRIKKQEIDKDFWIKHGIVRLLVVDDREEIYNGITNAMADTGVDIAYALGGLPAISMVEQAQADGQGYDLILIDWKMPDIDGIETARRIRRIIPSNVPIMILTAYDLSEIGEGALDAGINGFMQKPFFLSNFKNTIENLDVGNSANQGTEKEGAVPQEDILRGIHILAAEDNELNSEILLELLEMKEISCDLAKDGKEALEMFEASQAGQYDLILMDVQMPVMNGYEATRAIRRCGHPNAKTIPIIAMTANAFSEDVKAALDAGMDAHVSKPIDMEHLSEVIKSKLRE